MRDPIAKEHGHTPEENEERGWCVARSATLVWARKLDPRLLGARDGEY